MPWKTLGVVKNLECREKLINSGKNYMTSIRVPWNSAVNNVVNNVMNNLWAFGLHETVIFYSRHYSQHFSWHNLGSIFECYVCVPYVGREKKMLFFMAYLSWKTVCAAAWIQEGGRGAMACGVGGAGCYPGLGWVAGMGCGLRCGLAWHARTFFMALLSASFVFHENDKFFTTL